MNTWKEVVSILVKETIRAIVTGVGNELAIEIVVPQLKKAYEALPSVQLVWPEAVKEDKAKLVQKKVIKKRTR